MKKYPLLLVLMFLSMGLITSVQAGQTASSKKSSKIDAELTEFVRTAVKAGDTVQAEQLLRTKAGIDVNAQDSDAQTILHSAASEGEIEVAKLLVSKGADVNAVGPAGKTPVHLATESGQQAIVEYLLAHGANINAKDSEGNTPLHYATFSLNHVPKSIMELLIAKGADATIRNNVGFSASESDKYEAKLQRDIDGERRAEAQLIREREEKRAAEQRSREKANAPVAQAQQSSKHRYGANAYLCTNRSFTNSCDETIEITIESNQMCNGGTFTLRPGAHVNAALNCKGIATWSAIYTGE